ncbi:MAG TPA: TMEM165/GDT1 family protein [Candidatus Saccharimonadales bacterium]|jgi:putative Ca2+/H+ antiporter (TMEM165/GDT1 family)
MSLTIFGIVFVVIFLSELPDKSLFASLILSTKFRGSYVWIGAASAFLVHVIIAVTAGQILTVLPHRLLEAIVALLFLAGSLLMFFGKHGTMEEPKTKEEAEMLAAAKNSHGFWKVFVTTFGVIFLGEWGDITQIATANYAAHYRHDILSVAIGATLALWIVTAFAILAGAKILRRIPGRIVQRVAAVIFLIFAIITALSAAK